VIRFKSLFSWLLAGLALTAVSMRLQRAPCRHRQLQSAFYGAKGPMAFQRPPLPFRPPSMPANSMEAAPCGSSAGTWLSAPIVLKSNITLELDKGATLLGTSDHQDYPAKPNFVRPAGSRW